MKYLIGWLALIVIVVLIGCSSDEYITGEIIKVEFQSGTWATCSTTTLYFKDGRVEVFGGKAESLILNKRVIIYFNWKYPHNGNYRHIISCIKY